MRYLILLLVAILTGACATTEQKPGDYDLTAVPPDQLPPKRDADDVIKERKEARRSAAIKAEADRLSAMLEVCQAKMPDQIERCMTMLAEQKPAQQASARRRVASAAPAMQAGFVPNPAALAGQPVSAYEDWMAAQNAGATTCMSRSKQFRGLQFKHLDRVDKRANKVLVKKRGSVYSVTTGCWGPTPQDVVAADLSGNGRFDLPKAASNLRDTLSVPLRINEWMTLVWLNCDMNNACRVVQTRDYSYDGIDPYQDATGGVGHRIY